MSVIDLFLNEFTTVDGVLDRVVREILVNATVFEPISKESIELLTDRNVMNAYKENSVALTCRPMIMTPTFTVMTRTRFGHCVLGTVEPMSEPTETGNVEWTTTLPPSLFTVEELRVEIATGRWLVRITTHGLSATVGDLNARTTGLGRLVRFSVVESLRGAQPVDVNVDGRSDRIMSLARRAGIE